MARLGGGMQAGRRAGRGGNDERSNEEDTPYRCSVRNREAVGGFKFLSFPQEF